jgi:hypothetical protein
MAYTKKGTVDFRKIPRIVYRPLLKHGAEGMATQLLHNDTPDEPISGPLIEVDSRLKGRRKLDTEIHEVLHLACPWMPEFAVRRTATYLAMVLWHLGYRQKETPG